MYRFLSWYNQNRRKFWVAVLAIVIIGFIVFRLFNMMTESMNNRNNYIPEVDLNEFNSVSVTTQKSVVTGNNAQGLKQSVNIINDFISNCNSGNIEEAYKLLSDECKEKMYENIDRFKNNYYNPIFGKGKRSVTVTNWVGNIYKVDFNEDALSTGKVTKENNLQDYITIIYDKNGNRKLNINKYIKTVEINKMTSYEEINIKAVKKDVYFDNEVYTIEIENNSEYNIELGDVSKIGFSYLTDENNLKYNANMENLAQMDVLCVSNHKKTVQIKYYNQYNTNRDIKSLTFPKSIIELLGDGSGKYHIELTINF